MTTTVCGGVHTLTHTEILTGSRCARSGGGGGSEDYIISMDRFFFFFCKEEVCNHHSACLINVILDCDTVFNENTETEKSVYPK